MFAAFVSGLPSITAAPFDNMNGGGKYIIANNHPSTSVRFETDFGRKGFEYFEVYGGPISTRYGQVFWQGIDIPLPKEIVARFENGTIAITGYEMDQVFRSPGAPDKPVPITWAYNHHYVSWINGRQVRMAKASERMRAAAEGHPAHFVPYSLADPNPDSDVPVSQIFSEGNGGESRKSYHGYPRGMAQLVESPRTFFLVPMQIDTWNRNTTFGDPFVPGPESARSASPKQAKYSGHLECPCTNRIIKTTVRTFSTVPSGACGDPATDAARPTSPITTAAGCFEAGARLQLPHTRNVSVSDSALPRGCSLEGEALRFNALAHAAPSCGSGATRFAASGSSATVGFSLSLDAEAAVATITLSGDAAVWFGVALGDIANHNNPIAQPGDGPYAINVFTDGSVREMQLTNQGGGVELKRSLTLISHTVSDGTRTVVLSRPFAGVTPAHFSFSARMHGLSYIAAAGKSASYGYHRVSDDGQLALRALDGSTCVCDTGADDFIASDVNPPERFRKNCLPEPFSDLQRLKNPTCALDTYQGGLRCCRNGNILLDKHQNPWDSAEHRLTYWHKFRFYFEEHRPASNGRPASHQNLVRFFRETEAQSGEYDVMPAPRGTPPRDAIYQISGHFQAKDGLKMCSARTSPHCTGKGRAGINLVYASGHCHAPSCVKMELWNADTGMLICRQTPLVGTAPAATASRPYDERGYVAIPPCLFGAEAEGLLPEPFLAYDTNLTSIKWNNNTYAHFGEMAMWQMRGYQSWEPPPVSPTRA